MAYWGKQKEKPIIIALHPKKEVVKYNDIGFGLLLGIMYDNKDYTILNEEQIKDYKDYEFVDLTKEQGNDNEKEN